MIIVVGLWDLTTCSLYTVQQPSGEKRCLHLHFNPKEKGCIISRTYKSIRLLSKQPLSPLKYSVLHDSGTFEKIDIA
jgi:hypothetical protein